MFAPCAALLHKTSGIVYSKFHTILCFVYGTSVKIFMNAKVASMAEAETKAVPRNIRAIYF